MRNRCSTLIVSSMFLLLGFEAYCFGQDAGGELLKQKVSIHLSRTTFVYTLGTLAFEYKVPIGLEKSPAQSDEAKITIDVTEVPLRDVLDSIERQEPTYRWQLCDGVINFLPAGDRYPFVEVLLETPVAQFAPAKGSDKIQIRNAILQLPEVRSLMNSNGVQFDRFSDEPYRQSIYAHDEINLNTSHTTVRGILNKVIKESEYKVWVVEITGEKKKSLALSF